LNHQAHGHGLLGMHERVLECGGELTSGPDLLGGFAVTAVLPVTAA
jgi:signal transduction histidine kinase